MSKLKSFVLLVFVGSFLSACVTTGPLVSDNADFSKPGARVVLMPLDVQLSELTAGGLLEPNAEWTAKAEGYLNESLTARLEESGATLVPYQAPEGSSPEAEIEQQLVKLHSVVGGNIVLGKIFQPTALPTKKNVFDWGLGDKVHLLRDKYDADYAMFVFVRDSYASSGRAAAIFVGALFGVGIQGGTQSGFVSLVDLKTGEVSWFNMLARGTGDLREATKAEETVDELAGKMPL